MSHSLNNELKKFFIWCFFIYEALHKQECMVATHILWRSLMTIQQRLGDLIYILKSAYVILNVLKAI